MPDDRRLPIKVVLTRESDIRKPEGGGGGRKIFDDVTRELRESFVHQLEDVEHHFAVSFDESPDVPAVARVILKAKALAKSHRPAGLLTANTCPIIGAQNLGELLVSVTRDGLHRLMDTILHVETKVGVANVS